MKRSKRICLPFVICLLCGCYTMAESAEGAWNNLLSEKLRGRSAFAYVENNPALPNVLIYGDSISIMYTDRVREVLADKANVYRLHANGNHSGTFVEQMKKMHTTMQDEKLDKPWTFKWDVITFNVGLHDLKYVIDGKKDVKNGKQVNSIEVYQKNLRDIIAYLQNLAPEAKLFFVTTTPVPENSSGRIAGDAKRYNEAAMDVLRNHKEIGIIDLYSLSLPHQKEWWLAKGNVHFNEAGTNAQGDAIAKAITDEPQKKNE